MWDRTILNGVAMKTVKIVYPNIFDTGCLNTLIYQHWQSLLAIGYCFSHTIKENFLWKQQAGKAMVSYSAKRWWSKWKNFKQIMLQFGDIEFFLNRNRDLSPLSRLNLLPILTDQEKLNHLKLELAAVIDWGKCLL